jgi:dephospho-CoA kinase
MEVIMNKIVAIVGMCGSGKSIASEYFEKMGYKKVYYGKITIEKVIEAGLEVNEKNERFVREKLRKDYGMGAYAIVNMPKVDEAIKTNNVVIDDLYSWDELKILREKYGDLVVTLCIIADKNLRYARLQTRDIRPLTLEEAKSRDVAEIENSAKGGPIAFANYYVLNNSTIDDYIKRLDEILKMI